MTMVIKQVAGDTANSNDQGQTSVPASGSANCARINGVSVPHNASVVATTAPGTTPGDVVLDPNTYDCTKILSMSFVCSTAALNGNTLLPQVYVKLIGAKGSSHDLVIPMTPGQIWTWVNPAATVGGVNNTTQPNAEYDANGNAYTLEGSASVILPTALGGNIATVTCTPDKYSDVTISGTIEYLA